MNNDQYPPYPHRDSQLAKLVGAFPPLSSALILAVFVLGSKLVEGETQVCLYLGILPVSLLYLDWCAISKPYYHLAHFKYFVGLFRKRHPNEKLTPILRNRYEDIVSTKENGVIPMGGSITLNLKERIKVFAKALWFKSAMTLVLYLLVCLYIKSQIVL